MSPETERRLQELADNLRVEREEKDADAQRALDFMTRFQTWVVQIMIPVLGGVTVSAKSKGILDSGDAFFVGDPDQPTHAEWKIRLIGGSKAQDRIVSVRPFAANETVVFKIENPIAWNSKPYDLDELSSAGLERVAVDVLGRICRR